MPKNTFFNIAQEKRERILEAAKTAFSKKHYNDVTIDRIVALAKIPKGSFYQYFDNKDDLYMYMFHDLGTNKKSVLMQAFDKNTHLEFSDMFIELITKAAQFESKDETMINLKKRFLNEVSQEIKSEILSKFIPETIDLYKSIIFKYIQNETFREDVDVETAAFILTAVTMNIEQYPSLDKNDHGDALIKVCKLLEKGLI